jgi:hypothetical protein
MERRANDAISVVLVKTVQQNIGSVAGHEEHGADPTDLVDNSPLHPNA